MSGATDNLGPVSRLVGYHLRRTSSLIRKDFKRVVGDFGIHQVSFGVLSVISANPGIRQGEIGRMLDIQRANMVTMIGELSEAGLVDRGTDCTDRRAVLLSLTERGKHMLADVTKLIEAHEAALLGGLSPAEIGALLAMLVRISQSCES